MLRFVSAAAAAAALLASSAHAGVPLPKPAPALKGGSEVIGPYAFYDFCRRTPHQCEADATPGPRVQLTPEKWSELNEVNDLVNQTIIPMSDLQQYGVVDYWSVEGRYGNCHHYALIKQLYLRQRGWPISDLLMTVVFDEHHEGHAILTVRTTRGDYVLDNRQPRVVAWSDEPYTYIKRQASYNPYVWLAIEGRPVGAGADAAATSSATR